MTQTDFKIDYDLPYMMEIYEYINEKFPIFKTDTSHGPTNYSRFLNYVSYITYNNLNLKRSTVFKPDFEKLSVVKKWINNTPFTIDNVFTMKLMLIMKYIEDMNLSNDISKLFHSLPPSELTPSTTFALLSGCVIDNDIIDQKYPFKIKNNSEFNFVCNVPYDEDIVIKSYPNKDYNFNIPWILYESICIGLSYYFNKIEGYVPTLTFDYIEYVYGPAKFCYLYGKSDHNNTVYENPYYDFVYHKLFEPFKQYYGYPYTEPNTPVKQNFDDFIYTKNE